MKEIIPYKELVSQIFFIRGKRVIPDIHLAALCETDTRSLKQQVKRNIDRFPDDLMFILTKTEWKKLITNCDNLKSTKFSPSLPFAFTVQGVSMLSGVLEVKRQNNEQYTMSNEQCTLSIYNFDNTLRS